MRQEIKDKVQIILNKIKLEKKKEEIEKAIKTVTSYYDDAMMIGANGLRNSCSVNYYYEPNSIAEEFLIRSGILKKRYIGSIYVGMEYKGHLFVKFAGSGDCEERLRCSGKI